MIGSIQGSSFYLQEYQLHGSIAAVSEAPGREPEAGEAPGGIENSRKAVPAGEAERDQPDPGSGKEDVGGKEKADNRNTGNPQNLTPEELRLVEKLRARDREVRAHEQAHAAAAGSYKTSGPSYQYTRGPDGRRYAVGGEVGIDTSAEDTPEKTITKAQIIRRAALAPADPSAQDRSVASAASRLETSARRQIRQENLIEAEQRSEQAEQARESREAERAARSEQAADLNESTATEAVAVEEVEPMPALGAGESVSEEINIFDRLEEPQTEEPQSVDFNPYSDSLNDVDKIGLNMDIPV